jgi:hypothetical protein
MSTELVVGHKPDVERLQTGKTDRTRLADLPAPPMQRLLTGWMDRPHVLRYAQGVVMTMAPDAQVVFWESHEATIRSVSALQPRELSITPLNPLAGTNMTWANEVASTPVFKQNFGGIPFTFAYVPVEKLISFQPFLRPLNTNIPEDDDAVLRWCLPKDFSTNSSVTFSGNGPIPNIMLTTDDPNGQFMVSAGGAGVAFGIAPRPNWVQVVLVGDRYVVKNGYHRIVALAHRGKMQVPAVVTGAPDLRSVVPNDPSWFGPDYLARLSRPPVVLDFLEPSVSMEVPFAFQRRAFAVRLDVAEFAIPA